MIPTTDDLFKKHSNLFQAEGLIDKDDFKVAMIEFAKLHVEAALKAASENVVLISTKTAKQSILNAYPLTNIK